MKLPSVRGSPEDAAASATAEGEEGSSSPAQIAAPVQGQENYFRRLWNAELPLSRIFFDHMLLVGTAINLLAMGLAVVAVLLGASTPVGIAIHLLPVPYNIFLVACVWRRADIERSDWSLLAKAGAIAWLLIAFVV